MTYNDIWRRLAAEYGDGEAKAVARILLEDSYGLSYADVVCGGVESLPSADAVRLEADVARLEKGEPVQYVVGCAQFSGRTFCVQRGVLVPRPETEQLCSLVADDAAKRQGEKSVLDIGTGSGCIAITLSLDIPGAHVSAWDISADALAVARHNAAQLGASVNFSRQDALNPPADNARWDYIVSNPPYICERERSEMSSNVLDYEPATALFVPDADPLLFYRSIARYAYRALKPGGGLFFEINSLYAAETEEMLRSEGFSDVHTLKDIFGKERNVVARMIRRIRN